MVGSRGWSQTDRSLVLSEGSRVKWNVVGFRPYADMVEYMWGRVGRVGGSDVADVSKRPYIYPTYELDMGLAGKSGRLSRISQPRWGGTFFIRIVTGQPHGFKS